MNIQEFEKQLEERIVSNFSLELKSQELRNSEFEYLIQCVELWCDKLNSYFPNLQLEALQDNLAKKISIWRKAKELLKFSATNNCWRCDTFLTAVAESRQFNIKVAETYLLNLLNSTEIKNLIK